MTQDMTLTRWFGPVSAFAAAAFAVAYDIPQLLQVFGVLRDPWDRILIFAPSLALAPAYVLAAAAVHVAAPASAKVWSLAALALAVLYAGDVSQIYVMQLGAVIPNDLAGQHANSAFAACCAWHAPATAVDLLGYTYMSGSTALMAGAFVGPRRRWTRLALLLNGALAPVLIGQLAWPWLIYGGAIWMVTFPAAMILVGLQLRRGDLAA